MKNGQEIEALYNSTFAGSFPYNECQYLTSCLHREAEDLIPPLDWFFALIAGYSSAASRLVERSPNSLDHAKQQLSKSFFEYFPELKMYEPYITIKNTPTLQRCLNVSEELRLSLLGLIGS